METVPCGTMQTNDGWRIKVRMRMWPHQHWTKWSKYSVAIGNRWIKKPETNGTKRVNVWGGWRFWVGWQKKKNARLVEKVITERHHERNCGIMVCGDGDAVFPDQIALDRHMKGHKEDYSCPICQKQYSTKQSLGRHKTIHANIQIPCTLCDKKFKSKPCMVRLIRTCTEKIHMTFLIIFFTFHILKFLTVIYNFVHIAWFNV